MILKETYKHFGSRLKHFEINYQKYLQSKIKNEEEFILDMVETLEFIEIEEIISKFHPLKSKKEGKLIDFIDNSKECIRIRDSKRNDIFEKYNQVKKELPYAKTITYFVSEKCELDKIRSNTFSLTITKSFIECKYREIQSNIINQANLLSNYLTVLRCVEPIDALSAYIVFDKGKANRMFEKTMILGHLPSEFAIEAILDNWLVKNVDEPFLPHIDFKNILQIERINTKKLRESLYLQKLPFKTFSQTSFLNPKDIKNDKLFEELLSQLFKSMDKKFLKKDIEIFIYSITNQCNIYYYTDEEMIDVRNKINHILADNVNAKNLFCHFLSALNKSGFIKVNSLMKALEDYFYLDTHLSYANMSNIIYEKTTTDKDKTQFKNEIEKIVKNCFPNPKTTPQIISKYKKSIINCI